MALRTPEDDESKNPSHNDYEDKFVKRSNANDLNEAENSSSQKPDNSDINQAEQNPDNNWRTNVSRPSNKNNSKKGGLFGKLKKKGPLGIIVTIIVGGGFGLTTLMSPGLLLVQIKEVMVDKFNTQLTSMDIRTTKLLTAKTTTGAFCNTLNVRCKYSTMSAKELTNFEKAGIKVNYDNKTVFGQAKPTSFEFKGETIYATKPANVKNAISFSEKINASPEFRSALKTAYNPKFAGFADRIWSYAASKLKISKKQITISGETDVDKLKSVQDMTKEGVGGSNPKKVTTDDINPSTNKKYTAEEVKVLNDSIDDTLKNVDNIKNTNVKSASSAFGLGSSLVTNSLKVTGIADNACLTYTSLQTLGYAAKTVRAIQLASYAMIFLNLADQIKAGSASPEDVEYAGNILTKTMSADSSTGSPEIKSATDSFGYKYAAYGDLGAMPDASSQFMAGGGLAGSLIAVTTAVNQTLGGNPKKTCGFLNKPIVAAGSLVLGIASLFVPGVNAGMVVKSIAAAAAFSLAIAVIPSMLQDIIAGVLVDKTTVGELAGDALTSGSSGIMSSVAGAGGNAPMTPSEAVAYSNLSKQVAIDYDEEDRLSLSPFDISSSSTFLGSIALQITPYISRSLSVSNAISSLQYLTLGSFSSIFSPLSKAATTEEYTKCQDYDYLELGIATDPFCNVVYGIPPQYLQIEPLAVIDELQKDKKFPQIDENTGEPIKGSSNPNDDIVSYDEFITYCINRTLPLGQSGDDLQYPDGSNCLIGKQLKIGEHVSYDDEGNEIVTPVYIGNEYYYLYHMDQRVQKGMDGTDTTLSQALDSGQIGLNFFNPNDYYTNTAVTSGGYY